MTEGRATASTIVRLSVATEDRRVDLAVPGSVPVAVLLPEFTRRVGLLDAATVDAGYRLVTEEGRCLGPDAGLTSQGIRDGALLTLTAGANELPPTVYDDVVEAMADVVQRDIEPWAPGHGRRTTLAAAVLMLALGAAALVTVGGLVATVAGGLVSCGLLAGVLVLSGGRSEPTAAVAVTWLAAGFAAACGFLLAPPGEPFGPSLAGPGAGVLLVGSVAAAGLTQGSAPAVPLVLVGAFFGTEGLMVAITPLDLAVLTTVGLVLVVVTGGALPLLALGFAGTSLETSYAESGGQAKHREVDPSRVAAGARRAQDLLVAGSVTSGILLVVCAPFAVSLGLAGTLLAAACCLVVMLRARQYRSGPLVRVDLLSGVLGVATVAATSLWLYEGWRPTAAAAVTAIGFLALVVSLRPPPTSVRLDRAADLAETVALLVLFPLLVPATGALAMIRG